MKIESLTIHRFRSICGVTLAEWDRRVAFIGPNASGKTSVRESLRWLLLGSCLGTDLRGTGWESLIPKGHNDLYVTGRVPPLGELARHYTGAARSFNVSGVTGEAGLHQQAVFVKLETAPAYLSAVLDTEYFLHLHHADAKRLVLELLTVEIPLGAERLTVDQADARYKSAFDDRKLMKNRLKAFGLPTVPEPTPPSTEIAAQLGVLRADLETLVSRAGGVAQQRGSLERQLLELDRAMEPAIEVDQERLTALAAVAVASAGTGVHSALPSPAELRKHDPKHGCVLDSTVACKTAKVEFTTRAKALDEMVAVYEADRRATEEQDAKRAEWSKLKALDKQRLAVEARNADRLSRRTGLAAELAALPVVDTASEAEMAALRQRIQKGEDLRSRAAAYEDALRRRTEAELDRKRLEQEVARLEGLCEVLGPNGVRLEALQSAIGRFEARVNVGTERFGWTVRFQLDPWQALVNDRPIETYSESEQFRIGVALQLAVAELSGLSFAIIDRLDMLDTRNRGLVSQMISESPVEQIVLMATRERDLPLPPREAILTYRLEADHGVTRIAESNQLVPA